MFVTKGGVVPPSPGFRKTMQRYATPFWRYAYSCAYVHFHTHLYTFVYLFPSGKPEVKGRNRQAATQQQTS